jgi:hypothetical protein
MPKYPEHPPRDISDSCADDETDSEVKEGDISPIIPISCDSEYDRDDDGEYDETTEELRVDVGLCYLLLLLEMMPQISHRDMVISSELTGNGWEYKERKLREKKSPRLKKK